MDLVDKLLFGAVLAQLALTFGLLLWLGRLRIGMVTSRAVRMRDIALNANWPERAQQLANAVDNQFQLPVLFYIGVLFTLTTGTASWFEVVVGWLFVALRMWHAAIHTTKNRVDRRFFVWVGGFAAVIVYWIVLGAKVLLLAGTP